MNSEESERRVDHQPLLDEEVDNEAYPQVRIDEEGNEIQEHQENPEYQRSYRRDQRRAENLKKQINDSITEIALYASAIILIVLWLSFSASEKCNEPLQVWTLGALASYMIQLIIACYGYHYLKKWHSFSVKSFFVSGAVSIVYTAWLLWGNTLYYDDTSDCATKAADLMVLQCILLIFGYFDMMKCLVFSCIGSCFLIFRFRERRNGPRLNWMPAPDQFLKKLPMNKFNASEN